MEDRFVTITGVQHYYGMKPFKPGTIVLLVKEPDNVYDAEAVRVELPILGRAGYVANSPNTVAAGTRSAGRVYDTFGAACLARVLFVADTKIIARLEYGMKECVILTRMGVGGAADSPESVDDGVPGMAEAGQT